MASDFNKPVVGDAYATLLPGIVTMFQDLARGLEPTLVGANSNIPTGTIRWNATNNYWERFNGISYVTLPASGTNTFGINISGNAATATTAAACSGNAATATSATSATTATNLAGGAAGSMHYQTSAGVTATLAAGTVNQVLLMNGSAVPTWTAQSALNAGSATNATTATNLAGGAAGGVNYQTGVGASATTAAGTAGQLLQSNGTAAPTWVTFQGVPSGAVFWFAAVTPPSGYLECNGAAISRTTYSSLFSVIGTTWGAGDGTTTFNLPQLRGEFIRGFDNGRGVDIGRVFASAQSDAMQGHVHQVTTTLNLGGGGSGGNLAGGGSNFNTTTPLTDGTNGTPRTAAETRSRNISMLPCIKT